MIEVDDLIGTPFKYGGRGDGFYDCLGCLIECYRRKGTPLPEHESTSDSAANARAIFNTLSAIAKPSKLKPGAILVFRVKGAQGHLGFYLGEDEFIHAWEGSEMVVIDRLTGVWQKRLVGVYELK